VFVWMKMGITVSMDEVKQFEKLKTISQIASPKEKMRFSKNTSAGSMLIS